MKKYKFINGGKTIREIIVNSVEKFPNHTAFKLKDKEKKVFSLSFKEMYQDIRNLGTELIDQGLKGSKVGIIGENSYNWCNVFLSVVCSGGIGVPFDKGFKPEELASCIKRSGIKAIFFDSSHKQVVEQAFEYLEEEKNAEPVRQFQMEGEDSVLESLKNRGKEKIETLGTEFDSVEIDEDNLAVILFTSGTTSTSKAVMLSHKNISSNIYAMHNYETFYPDDVNMAFLPFHHSFGLVGLLVFLGSGAANVFCDGLKYVTKNFNEYGVTVFVGVPLIVENMYKKIWIQIKKNGLEKKVSRGLWLSKTLYTIGIDARRKIFKEIIRKIGGNLRIIICGAAPLAPEAAHGFNAFGISMLQGYGLTETSPVLAAETPEDLCPGSVGKPLPGVEIQIKNKDESGIGEIVARGPNIMLGYMDQPEETNSVIKNQWFHTGDLGKFDETGHLWIMGRKKNVIVMKNGKNVFPEEIEENIGRLPYVVENMIFTREKHNEHVLWAKIVYSEAFIEQEKISFTDFVKRVARDLKEINQAMPIYKNVHHFILDKEGMIKTTTQKVKRNLEIARINSEKDDESAYKVE